MKKFISSVFIAVSLLVVTQSSVCATDYSAFSNDAVIRKAISLTLNINSKALSVLEGENSTMQTVTVQFANLSSISINYINDDAVTVIDNDGRMKIYIDKSLRNSPPEAIACLIEHETTHNDAVSSVNEEVVALTKEATSWIYFTRKNPSLAKLDETTYPLINRLNYITALYKKSGYNSIAIRGEVFTLSDYSKLAVHSAGY